MSDKNNDPVGFAPNAPTDGRDKGNWQTRYPIKANKQILIEAIYLIILLFFTPALSFLIFNDFDGHFKISPTMKKYAYAWCGGAFGGVVFDIKWLYHSVAKNIWNEDRRWWRIFTPHISGGVAFAVVVLISSKILNIFSPEALDRPSTIFGLSFLTGYFSDAAIGKLTEVANTFFGSTGKQGDHNNR